MFLDVLIAVLAIGIAIGAYAIFAPRRRAPVATAPPAPAARATPQSEAQRIDAAFAMGALDGDESTRRLTEALDDPSETVALAAAHALAGSGRGSVLEAYAARNPGERSARLLATIGLLHEG